VASFLAAVCSRVNFPQMKGSLGMPHHCADRAGSEAAGCWAFAAWARYGAMALNRNGAVTSAVLVHPRVKPAHFDWRWRERPALALLVWEASSRSIREVMPHPSGVNWNDN
jgi:hypothetical protein